MRAESRYRLGQTAGLLFQRGGGRCGFLNQRGVLLRYAIHFGNGQSDLIDTPALLIRGGGDFAHDIRDARNGIDDVSHGFPGAFHQHRTGIDTRDGIFNQRFYFFRRTGAAAGQITHLACHDRKTAPLLSRARRFYRRVQRQNVSLEGNTVDNADNVSDFFELSAISCMVFTTPSTTLPP